MTPAHIFPQPQPSPPRSPAEIALGIQIAHLALSPTDILLVRASTDFNLQTLDHLAGMLRDFLPSKRFVIYTGEMDFTVIKDCTNLLTGYQGAARC